MHENLIDKLATLIENDASVPETANIDECILDVKCDAFAIDAL